MLAQPKETRVTTVLLVLAFGTIYLVWGSTFLAIRFAVQTLPPLLTMAIRHLAAGGLLFAWAVRRDERLPDARTWVSALVAGAVFFLGCHGLLAWAELTVESGMAALLSATLPFFMVLIARFRGEESELTGRVISGLVMGLFGVAVLMGIGSHGLTTGWLGALAIIGGEALWAWGAIYVRGVRTASSGVTFTAMQMLSGGALLAIAGAVFGEFGKVHAASFTGTTIASLLFLIFFGSIAAFTAYNWLLKVSTPARISTHSYVNPVVAVFLGWLLGGEGLSGRMLAGTAIILASVALLNSRKRAPAPALQEEFSTAD